MSINIVLFYPSILQQIVFALVIGWQPFVVERRRGGEAQVIDFLGILQSNQAYMAADRIQAL